jgi:enamine deaminase RidA (YjgF/YER057c/UK114 family)
MTSLVAGLDAPRSAGALMESRRDTQPIVGWGTEFVITERQLAGETVGAAFQRLSAGLAATKAELLSLMVYGSLAAYDEIQGAMHNALGETNWPVTWIEGGSCDGVPLAGVQAFAISGGPVTRVRLGRRVVGSVYEDGGARHCLLGGLGPTALSLPSAAQAQQTLGNLEWALGLADFTLGDVVRTWFYNDDILAWYDAFNRVRSAHYAGVKFRTGSLPASTGIGARNPAGTALAVAAWAVQPRRGTARVREIGSPMQCPAPAYGSSFSRAMEIDSGGWRRLLVSGTASIFSTGRTAWVNDARKQVDLTMEVVAEILHSRAMSFDDVTRATAYFKRPHFKAYFDAWCAEHDFRDLPVLSLHCDVCRDDLLFEIELDAVQPSSGGK